MIGRILFAWQKGPYLDSNSKMWRLYADIMNDLSFFVDLLAPFAPKFLTIYVISFSGLLRVFIIKFLLIHIFLFWFYNIS